MPFDAKTIMDLFTRLGDALAKPATLCLIGSTPGIATGQPDRQTGDLDVWNPQSSFDTGDLRRACETLGVLFDPRGEIKPQDVYLQIVRPGVVRLPETFEPEEIGRFGNLSLVMPPPEVIAAAKLVRATPVDIEDVVWWVRQRGLDASDIQLAINSLPNRRDRETATENIVFVELVIGRDWK